MRFPCATVPAALLAAGVLLCGCAGPQVDPQITAALAARNVDPSVYTKIYNGRALTYQDILDLVRKRVPTKVIVGYLASTEKVYDLTSAQRASLKRAGATPQLLNYLAEPQGYYGYVPPKQAERVARHQKDAYYQDPYYQDEMPFGYNPPIVDTWYDSAYEESLYSPFSFN